MAENLSKPKAYISKVVVEGFKSYGPKRREIPLGEGFIAVVGPNGSGKSNIGDAISFALGLASSKVLRAKNLSYLIWNRGNQKAEHAYVEVHFKNLGAFPVEEEEIVFSRKVFPNGRSVFKINGKTVKERDVKELLTRAGITENAYNIVLQGDIIHFLKMTPLQRRKLIEDISGIGEFDEKKEKALLELGEVEVKLKELKLVLDELESQLKTLEEDKRKLETYKRLKKEEENLRKRLLLKQLFQLEKKRKELLNQKEVIEKRISTLEGEKEEKLQRLEIKEKQLEELEKLLEPHRERLGKLEAEEEFLKNELTKLNGEREKLLEELQKTEEEIGRLQKELQSVDLQVEKILEEKKKLEEELLEKETELEKFDRELQRLEERFGNSLKRLHEVENLLKELSKDKTEKERELNNLLRELERLDQKVEQSEESLKQLEEQKREILSLFVGKASAEKEKLQKVAEEKKLLVENLKNKLQNLDKKLSELRKRREELLKEIARLEAQSSAVENEVVAYLKRRVEGVYGAVAELIKVKEEEYIVPVEVAGGNRLRYVVVDNEEVAKRCVEILKRENLGRLTFIPLNRIRAPRVDFLPRTRGVIDFVYRLVDFDPHLEKAILYVFGDTILVEDFETARRLGIGIYRMVTLEGELFEKGGTITGGTYKTSNLLQGSYIKGKLEELRNELKETERRYEKLSKEFSKTKEKLWSEEGALNYALRKIEELEKSGNSAVEKLKKLEERIKQGEEFIAYLKEEIGQKEKLLERLQDEINRLEFQIEELESEKAKLFKEVSQSGLEEFRNQRSEKQKELNLLREELNKKEKELLKVENLRENLQRDLANKVKLKEEIKEKLKTLEEREGEVNKRLEEIKEQLNQLGEKIVELLNRREELKKERENLKRELTLTEAKLEKEKNERERFLTELAKLEQEIETLKGELGEVFPQEEPKESVNRLKELLKDVQIQLEKLGNINFRVEEEYSQVGDRYREIKEKYQTLQRERKALLSFISEIEKKKEKIFMETFKTINRYFKEIFSFLSPGGKAYMELEKPYAPFDGGINMFVKPRGKEVKYLEAMSGGEKTLAALSLIFALQRHRPAPFYYFDEVDAHLDEANAVKVGELIKQYSSEAQFIVVTLRESVAYMADRIVGVTSKGGVSQTYFLEPSTLG